MNKIYIGDTAGFTVSVVFAGAVADLPAPDLSAADVSLMVKKNVTDPDYKALFVQTISKPDTNIVYFEMKPEDTAKLVQGTYKISCKIFYESGTELTVYNGDLVAIKGVFGG